MKSRNIGGDTARRRLHELLASAREMRLVVTGCPRPNSDLVGGPLFLRVDGAPPCSHITSYPEISKLSRNHIS